MSTKVWGKICEYEFAVRVLSVLVFTLGLLTLFSLPHLEPGTPEYAVSTYNLIVISGFLVVILAVRFKCD